MPTHNRKRTFFLLLVSVSIVGYLFWCPLFLWNPLKIGYEKITSPKATVYISELSVRDSVVYRMDEILREEEKFHALHYVDNFVIIILNENSDMRRYLPWIRGSGYSVSLSLANVIYIGPAARKSSSGIEPFLKHELSHLLMDQNTSFAKAMKIHEQGWFTEGVAEYYSGRYLYSKSEFFALAKKNGISFTSLYEKNPLKMSAAEAKLRYSYYRFFIEFLVDNYGIEKLQGYLKRYINNPDAYKDYFVEIYSKDVEVILQEYKSSW